jgi:hypothetical protein
MRQRRSRRVPKEVLVDVVDGISVIATNRPEARNAIKQLRAPDLDGSR